LKVGRNGKAPFPTEAGVPQQASSSTPKRLKFGMDRQAKL